MAKQDKNLGQRIELYLAPETVKGGLFVQGTRSFLSLVSSVAESIDSLEAIDWDVKVREGSNVVMALPRGGMTQDFSPHLNAVVAGLASLEERAERPRYFGDKAVRHVKVLAKVLAEVGGSVRFGERLVNLTYQAVANADKLLGAPVHDFGSIEGELLLLSDVRGPEIGIRDELRRKYVKCKFNPQDLDEVTQYFHKRVAIRGVIAYRPDGEIISVNVHEFRPLKERSQVPTIDQVKGILRDREN